MGLQLLSPKPIKAEPSYFEHQTSTSQGQNNVKKFEVQSNGAISLTIEKVQKWAKMTRGLLLHLIGPQIFYHGFDLGLCLFDGKNLKALPRLV